MLRLSCSPRWRPTIKRRKLIITEPARDDLDSIYDYIGSESLSAADRFITAMVDDLARIADLGVTGVARDWIRPGLRLHIYGKYCAYFRYDDERLIILRIVHGARDIDAMVFDPKTTS